MREPMCPVALDECEIHQPISYDMLTDKNTLTQSIDWDVKDRRTWHICLILLGCAAVLMVLHATRQGLGVSADSVYYIGTARELAAGNGPYVTWGRAEPYLLEFWPPMYPIAVALTAVGLGMDSIQAAQVLNAVAFGGLVLLVCVTTRRMTGSVLFAIAAASLVLIHPTIGSIFAMAWSEPLFVLLGISGLTLAGTNSANGRNTRLWLSGIVIGLAAATRYAGLSISFAIALTYWKRNPTWRGFSAAARFLMLTLLPLGLWLAFRIFHNEPATTRSFNWNPHWTTTLNELARGVRSYVVVASRSNEYVVLSLVVITLALIQLTARLLARSQVRHTLPRSEAARSLKSREATQHEIMTGCDAIQIRQATLRGKQTASVMGCGAICYLAFYFVAITMFDPHIDLWDPRHLLYPVVATLLWILYSAFYCIRHLCSHSFWRPAEVVGVVLLIGLGTLNGLAHCDWMAHTSGRGGQGYHDQKWCDSETMSVVRNLPADAVIYSNAPDALYYRIGRHARWLPRGSTWRAEQRAICAAGQGDVLLKDLVRGAYVVFFRRVAWRGASPREEDIPVCLPVAIVRKTSDGVVFAYSHDHAE